MHCALSIFLFWSLLWVLYPKHIAQFQGSKNIPFFCKFCCFWHPFQCTRVHRLLEKTTLFTCFLVQASYPPLNTSDHPHPTLPPPPDWQNFWKHFHWFNYFDKGITVVGKCHVFKNWNFWSSPSIIYFVIFPIPLQYFHGLENFSVCHYKFAATKTVVSLLNSAEMERMKMIKIWLSPCMVVSSFFQIPLECFHGLNYFSVCYYVPLLCFVKSRE